MRVSDRGTREGSKLHLDLGQALMLGADERMCHLRFSRLALNRVCERCGISRNAKLQSTGLVIFAYWKVTDVLDMWQCLNSSILEFSHQLRKLTRLRGAVHNT